MDNTPSLPRHDATDSSSGLSFTDSSLRLPDTLKLPAAEGNVTIHFRTEEPAAEPLLQKPRTSRMFSPMSKAPNQTLIARQLNLAPGTVSRALRQQPGIKSETRERVLKLAQKLGYTVRLRGKAAVEAEACYLGVLVQSPESSWTHTRYLVGLSEAAAAMNVTLIVHHVSFQDCLNIVHADRQPPAMRDGRVKGLCLVHRWPEDVARQLAEKFACVSVVHFYPGAKVDLVDMDHRGGMNVLAQHLYGLGHRKIGYFGYCGDMSWSRARYAGYVEAMTKLRLELNPAWAMEFGPEVFEQRLVPATAPEQALRLIKSGVRAWMATNEWAGQMLAQIVRDAGLRVPEDVSITGFDNTDTVPRPVVQLTSVGVSLSVIGTAAIQRLNQRLANPDEPRQNILFDVEFVPGNSTGPLNA